MILDQIRLRESPASCAGLAVGNFLTKKVDGNFLAMILVVGNFLTTKVGCNYLTMILAVCSFLTMTLVVDNFLTTAFAFAILMTSKAMLFSFFPPSS